MIKKNLINSIFLYAHKKARENIFKYGVTVAYLLETHPLFRKYYIENLVPDPFIKRALSTIFTNTEKIVAPIVKFLPHKSLLYFTMKGRLISLVLGENNFRIPKLDLYILIDTANEIIKVILNNAQNLKYKDVLNFCSNDTLQLIIFLKYFKTKE